MVRPPNTTPGVRLTLDAVTAADLMSDNPVSIRAEASVMEAVAMLTDRGFSAAPVIDEAGRPVGVLSRADLVTHTREMTTCSARIPAYYEESPATVADETDASGLALEIAYSARVRDIM